MDVSVIIVNYNTRELLINCITSIYEQTKAVEFEIIVTDNGSTDGSVEKVKKLFPNVILIENNKNLGFGAANNRALNIAEGKYIFYLNSDTVLLNNSIKFFFDYWETFGESEGIGALGTNLLDQNQEYTLSYAKFPDSTNEIKRFIKKMILTDIQFLFPKYQKNTKSKIEVKYGDVDYICGADLFIKNNEFARFDELFFLYYEETDLQYKMYQNGLRRCLIEGPRIIHLEGGSDRKDNSLYSKVSFGNQQKDLSRILYLNKNVSKKAAVLLKILLKIYWSKPLFKNKTLLMRTKLKEIVL